MSRMSFSTARTGQRSRGGGGMLQALKWDIGDRKRLIFPIVDEGLVIFAKPFHPVLNNSVRLLKSNGSGTYPVGKIRCMHPFSQTNSKESLDAAKSGEICFFCDLAKYEQRRLWDDINEEFGEDGFSELSKKEMKEYFEEAQEDDTVEASFYQETDSDGEKSNRTHFDMYILALELQTKKGKVVEEKGIAKYTPIVVPVSKSRLSKFKDGVDNAISAGLISEEMLYPYTENPGQDSEEEVNIGFVDFMVNFPEAETKMESGRKMAAQPVSEKLSVISDELIEDFESKAEDIVKQAETLVNNFYVNLKAHTREEAEGMLDKDEGYFTDLEKQYRFTEPREGRNGGEIPTDDDNDQSIFTRVLEANEEGSEGGDDEDSSDEETEDKPKEPARKRKAGTRKAPRASKEEESDDEDDEEDEAPKARRKRPRRTKPAGESTGAGKTGTRTRKRKPVEPKVEEELDEDIDDETIFDVED